MGRKEREGGAEIFGGRIWSAPFLGIFCFFFFFFLIIIIKNKIKNEMGPAHRNYGIRVSEISR